MIKLGSFSFSNIDNLYVSAAINIHPRLLHKNAPKYLFIYDITCDS